MDTESHVAARRYRPLPNAQNYRRHLGEGLGRRPSVLENAAMWRTARLMAEADRVLADPNARTTDKAWIAARVELSQAALKAMLKPPEPRALTLEELLADDDEGSNG